MDESGQIKSTAGKEKHAQKLFLKYQRDYAPKVKWHGSCFSYFQQLFRCGNSIRLPDSVFNFVVWGRKSMQSLKDYRAREFYGYGPNPPDPEWPDGAKIALQFVINYEEGGESNILHGDKASEHLLSEIVGAVPWEGQRNLNIESLYEYGARVGFWRLYRLFTERNMKLTVFAVAKALELNPAVAKAMVEADWEIATHGFRWLEYKDVDEEEERFHIREAVRIQKALTGERPYGIYQGKPSINTLRLTMEEGGFIYSSDSYADELPYWVKGIDKPFLMIPYTLDVNDMRFATAQGFNSGEQFFNYLKDSFDVLYEEGEKGSPKMLSIGLHCRLVGHPGRAKALEKFLDYVAAKKSVYIARRIDIARHWQKVHPAK